MNSLNDAQIEQLREFNDCIVMHPLVKVIFDDFDELRLNRKFQSDPQCMLLTGDTGVGKSHLINHYKKRVLASQNYSRETIPILVSRIAIGKGVDATLIQMLADLELFGSSQRKKRGYSTDLTKKIVENLKRAQVELLIINEFQELIEFKGQKERQNIANKLKYISEEAQVPIVLVGMPWAEQIAEEPQWSSRLVRRRKLEYFSLQKDSKYYRQYLMGLAQYMPFDVPPKLENKHTAVALFAVCKGQNRALKHFLSEAIKLAVIKGRGLENIHFVEAYKNLYLPLKEDSSTSNKKSEDNPNPFTQNLQDIEISEVIEPSRYNPNAMEAEHMLVASVYSDPQTLSQLRCK
ncbi:TniB family NTP-binding protein [Psychromonas hadalis]|uniref:TniB family NTP-binding protein n=1 Tax=Psychromonas hadalis TaxID=211669 RepID=UPI0003B4932C|nr:TniB family NTP-binding protein [Psychromonas hadalis]